MEKLKQLGWVLLCVLLLVWLTLGAWGWAKRRVVEEARRELRAQLEVELARLKESAAQHRSAMEQEIALIEHRMVEEMTGDPATKANRTICRLRGPSSASCNGSPSAPAP
jgi:hypothetical protein